MEGGCTVALGSAVPSTSANIRGNMPRRTEAPMRKMILIGVALFIASVPATSQTKCDVNSTNPICKLPQLGTSMASQGYVSAKGTWTPDGLINNADVEIEC